MLVYSLADELPYRVFDTLGIALCFLCNDARRYGGVGGVAVAYVGDRR